MQDQPKELGNFEELFAAGSRVAKGLRSQVTNLDADTEPEHLLKAVQFFFFCKALKTYQAVVCLWRNGFNEDGWILVRVMLELLLQSKYVNTDGERLARQFAEHSVVAKMDWYSRAKASGDQALIEQMEEDKAHLDDLKARFKEIRGKSRGAYWWNNSVAWLAKQVGLEKEYLMTYVHSSGFAHSGAGSVSAYLHDTGDELLAYCHPDETRDEMIPLWAANFMINIASEVSGPLQADIAADIAAAATEFKRITGVKP